MAAHPLALAVGELVFLVGFFVTAFVGLPVAWRSVGLLVVTWLGGFVWADLVGVEVNETRGLVGAEVFALEGATVFALEGAAVCALVVGAWEVAKFPELVTATSAQFQNVSGYCNVHGLEPHTRKNYEYLRCLENYPCDT